MKKTISACIALMFASAMTLSAQTAYKVDEEGLNKKIAKSDADIANPKKNAKAATWLSRGDLFLKVADAPVAGLYREMSNTTAQLLFGSKVKKQSAKVGETNFDIYRYPYFTTYSPAGADYVLFWDQTKFVDPDALLKSEEAFMKAYELDPKAKVKENRLETLVSYYLQNADNNYNLQKYPKAAEAFAKVYELRMHPAINVIDTVSIFNAGLLATSSGEYQDAIKYLGESIKHDYSSNGDGYYYLSYSLRQVGDVEGAKKVLFEGLGKYPEHASIVEELIQIYTGGKEDPNEVIPVAEKVAAANPDNEVVWGGLGRLYDNIGDFEKAIDAFKQVNRIQPNTFDNNYNIGLLYTKRADNMIQVLNSRNDLASQKEYEAELEKVRDAYEQSLEYYEKALEINPQDRRTIEMLKNIYNRLQARPGMKAQYEKYEKMLNDL